MLADRSHAAATQAALERAGEVRHRVRIAVQGPIAYNGASSIIEIEHGDETEIDAAHGQLAGDARADPLGLVVGHRRVAIPALTELSHRRHRRETFAKALHASALVIDADEQRRIAHRANRRGQRLELLRGGVVARKQDHAADQRIADALAVLGGKLEAGDVEH